MTRSLPRVRAAGALAVLATFICVPPPRLAAQARADSGHSTHPPYTPADVRFMAGMIHHHSQAVLIAGWAPSHDASRSVRTLCERIVVAQRDDIALMQRWLRDRGEEVPDPGHDMLQRMDHSMIPGMLTAEQLARLDAARGPEFDRLFLRFMIQHHQGAIAMVNQLFDSGAGEEETVFKFASDVFADQTTEIDRMQKMLAALLFAGGGD